MSDTYQNLGDPADFCMIKSMGVCQRESGEYYFYAKIITPDGKEHMALMPTSTGDIRKLRSTLTGVIGEITGGDN